MTNTDTHSDEQSQGNDQPGQPPDHGDQVNESDPKTAHKDQATSEHKSSHMPIDRDSESSHDDVFGQMAIFTDGKRTSAPETVKEAFQALSDSPDSFAWIGVIDPSSAQITELGDVFKLPPLAVEDAINAHQRAKAERYDDVTFIVLRPAYYLDEKELVELGELHMFVGANFVISLRHGNYPDLDRVRSRLEDDQPELLKLGPPGVVYAILDRVVDEYFPILDGIENDVDEIATQVFRGDQRVSERIYKLSQEAIELQIAINPLPDMINNTAGVFREDAYARVADDLRDVNDHVLRANSRATNIRSNLEDILNVNATLVAERQNTEMEKMTEISIKQGEDSKKISGWAGIIAVPTVIAGIYGMNFQNIPGVDSPYGYYVMLAVMALSSFVLYLVFKRNKWL